MSTTLNGVKNYNKLGYKGQDCYNQIVNERVVPKELLQQLLEEHKPDNFEKNLRAIVALMNNPRVVDYTTNGEKRAQILNSKEKKCQILAVLFNNIKDNVEETIAYFDELISDDDLSELKCVINFQVNSLVLTREIIHSIMRGLKKELFGLMEDPLVCIAQEAYNL